MGPGGIKLLVWARGRHDFSSLKQQRFVQIDTRIARVCQKWTFVYKSKNVHMVALTFVQFWFLRASWESERCTYWVMDNQLMLKVAICNFPVLKTYKYFKKLPKCQLTNYFFDLINFLSGKFGQCLELFYFHLRPCLQCAEEFRVQTVGGKTF